MPNSIFTFCNRVKIGYATELKGCSGGKREQYDLGTGWRDGNKNGQTSRG